MRHYRDIPQEKILKFKATPGFKGWEHFFTDESVSHPAKMNLNLLRHILRTYTSPGDIVLDPMAGTGSTVVLAGAMGRHGIGVEYEPKFCKMIVENIHRTEKYHTFTPGGQMTCINGDARELSKHLIGSDVIISSPPYGNRLSDVAIQDGDTARMGYRQAVDVVLTSPPYSNIDIGGDDDDRRVKRLKDAIERGDKISMRSRRWIRAMEEGRKGATCFNLPRNYSKDPQNIGALPHGDIDSIITSPPYEDSRPFHDIEFMKSIVHEQNIKSRKGETKGHTRSDAAELRYLNKIEGGGYEKDENIGNLKSDNYLQAMLQVYRESYLVLRPLGKIVLVTKNFIRNKKVIRLDLDTIKLCESVGFSLKDRWYFKLPTKSFWKILYHKKYPDVDEVKYEDILVFEKPDFGVPPKEVTK